MIRNDIEGQALAVDADHEARLRAVAEATLVGVQAALVAISTRNRALEEERDRLTREIAALAQMVANSGLQKGIDPDRLAGVAQIQEETLLRMTKAETLLQKAKITQADAEAQLQKAKITQAGAEAKLQKAELALAEAEGRYRGILQSTSWRVTGPLRRLIRLVRGR